MSDQTPTEEPAAPTDEVVDMSAMLRERKDMNMRERLAAPDRYGPLLIMILTLMIVSGILGESRVGDSVTVLMLGATVAELARLREFTSAVSFLLIFAMIFGIGRRLATHMRISWSMLAGALCAYLLVGLLFASSYTFMSAVQGGSIFAQITQVEPVDTMYFSFITMTTVGYGDLTPAQDLPRMIAVTEALIGQIYLVTAVGLLVGNMGRERRARTTPTD